MMQPDPSCSGGEGALAGSYTPIEPDRARKILEQNFGLTGTLKRFDTEKDDTFRVKTASGALFVLKIANPDEDHAELDFQNSILRHVQARDQNLPVPRVVSSGNGRDITTITDLDGQTRHVRVLTFLEGTPLCETNSDPAQRRQIGRILARLRLAMTGFTHPWQDRVYPWDVQHLLKFAHLLDEVEDPTQRDALAQGLERYRAIAPRVKGLRRQVLHNDFSKSNIVVDHGDPAFVKGIIDFGDSVNTAIAIDVATALLNQLPEQPHDDLFYRGRDVLEGYLERTDLTEEELALIPHLVMARVVVRALLTLWRAKLFPENERYIMRNTAQGWHQLDWFLAHTPDEISALLTQYSAPKG
ncbi:phosphotransferase [Pseudohalocynthiibacter aestuariivivens]|nr:phosphotransferase [Pseudohalocynthiibacter aestuariivivens]QIE46275.1 phosphotransferase [Pseudohalocynthiibacter aestuariivivens]